MKNIIYYSLLGSIAVLLTACGSSYQSVELPLVAKPSNYYQDYNKKNPERYPEYHLIVSSKTIDLNQLSAQGISIPDKLTVDGKEIAHSDKISIGDLYSDDLHKKPFVAQKNNFEYSGDIYIYQIPYSIIIADRVLNTNDPAYANKKGQLHINFISGLYFYDLAFLNNGGIIGYQGKAYFRDQVGNIDYQIKFGMNRQTQQAMGFGSGQINGLNHYGKIELTKGKIGVDTAKNSGINFQGNSLAGVQYNQQLNINITGMAKNDEGEIGSYALGVYGVKFPNNIMGGVIDNKTQEHIFFGAEKKD